MVGAIKEPRKGGFRVGGCSNTDLCLQASPMLRAGSLAVAAFHSRDVGGHTSARSQGPAASAGARVMAGAEQSWRSRL